MTLLLGAIPTAIYVPVGLGIVAAGIPISQALPDPKTRLGKAIHLLGVSLCVAAVAACAVAVLLSIQEPPKHVPFPLELLVLIGSAVLVVACASIPLQKVLPLGWAMALSTVIGIAVVIGGLLLANSVADLTGRPIEVEDEPRAVAVDEEAVWVAHADGLVSRIDPDSNSVVGPEIRVPLEPGAELFHVTAGMGFVWAMDSAGWIYRIDPDAEPGAEPRRVTRVGEEEGEITIARNRLWVNGYEAATVVRVHPKTFAKRTFPLKAAHAADLAYGRNSLWIANDSDHQITQFSPAKWRVVNTISLPGDPNDVAFTDGVVLATYYLEEKLVAIDARSGDELWTTALDRQPSGIAVMGGKAWVSNYARDMVIRVDIESGDVDARFETAAGPTDVAAGFGSAWVTNFDQPTVTRIASF